MLHEIFVWCINVRRQIIYTTENSEFQQACILKVFTPALKTCSEICVEKVKYLAFPMLQSLFFHACC